MKELDPGHWYKLDQLDQPECALKQFPDVELRFVKREGEGYPGNIDSHPGTTTQEVLRALIKRARYVNGQIPDERNLKVISLLRETIILLEDRAAERAGINVWVGPVRVPVDDWPTCPTCGHLTAWCKGRH